MAMVFVTSVPTEFSDLVQVYAENENQGGGRLKSFDYDASKQCVMIEFVNETDVKRFIDKKLLTILGHEMPITKASGESTIYIYDVPPNFKEDLDCILESPRKGGGPIADLVFIDEMGAAEVTFEESRVARNFVDQGVLKMGSERLPISYLPPSIYRPQFRFHLLPNIIQKEQWTESPKVDVSSFEDVSQLPRSSNVPASDSKVSSEIKSVQGRMANDGKLLLRAFDLPKFLGRDHLKMLLENERFGGGALHFYQFFDDEGAAHFSFVCDKVGRTMLSKGEVNIDKGFFFRVEAMEACSSQQKRAEIVGGCSIEKNAPSSVVGLKIGAVMGKDEIMLYAENKRSGGGPIRSLNEINPTLFIIHFYSAKAAESFHGKDHSSYFKGKTSTIMLEPWPENFKPCAIYVEGFKPSTTADVLKLYFENPRSGGRSESVQQVYIVRNGVACLVFNDSSVVASILDKGTWKLGEDLKVVGCQPARPPPLIGPDVEVDPYWLRFKEINLSSLSHKDFKEFVSAAAKSTVEQVMFEKESGQALVKFNEKPDYKHVLETLCCYPFCGIMISVEKVPITDSISVTSRGNISPELLKLYFENPRSGGGRIKDIRPCSDSTYVIQFEDHKVVDRVVKKPQKLGDASLTVKPHRESIFLF